MTATLTRDGQLTVSRGPSTVLATAPGVPLFSVATDAAHPTGFHDPEKLSGVTLDAVPPADIALDSPAAGVLHLTATSAKKDTVLASLALGADDGFYTGLGERYDHADPRGQIVGMQLEVVFSNESGTTDRHVPVPWIVSSRGYGVFVKERAVGAWDVASTDAKVVRATFEDTKLDVTIVIDPDPLAVVAKLGAMTGLQRKTPTWVLGPMLWRHVDTQAELLSDLAMIRSLHLPTTTFWIDDGWQTGLNTFDFDAAKYTSTAAMAKSLAEMGFKWLLWSSPYLASPASGEPASLESLYASAAKAHDFVLDGSGKTYLFPGPGGGAYGLVDFTRPSATKLWSGLAGKPVAIGADGYKLDYGEDLVPDVLGAALDAHLADGETERTARTYPLGYDAAYRDALQKSADGGVLIVRASTYGGASVADIVWPGDLDNGFEIAGTTDPSGQRYVGGLPASVVAGITLGASGFPLYGADTGGYRGGAPTKEALLRWAEHTALSMVMQLGPGEDKYPWNYDAATVATYTKLAGLHQALVPYLASLLAGAEASGTPTLRALPLAYPGDADAPKFADTEYLLGPDLLVAPVVTAGASSRSVHLPPGAWASWWTGAKVTGPATITAPAAIGTPPLYARVGALLPMLPDGIDTLVGATDPGTVSLDAMAGEDEAMGWVQGQASARWLDGSTGAITDDAKGVTLAWSPQGTGKALTATLDLSEHTGKAGKLTALSVTTGAAPRKLATAAAVRAATGPAYYLAGDEAVVRVVGATRITLH